MPGSLRLVVRIMCSEYGVWRQGSCLYVLFL
jgi:hypothetical protein